MASETKGTAGGHNGWSAGDGRIYNNAVCRSLTSGTNQYYYTWAYGFTALGASNTVTGIYITAKMAFHPGATYVYDIQLSNATTAVGTAKTGITAATGTLCAAAGTRTHGSSSDLWGVSAANLKTYINANTLGIRIRASYVSGIQYWEGAQLVVYYTVPGYGYRVNEVPSVSISTVNEVPTASIAKVNET